MALEHRGVPQEQLSVLDAISHLLTVSNFDLNTLLNEICRITTQELGVKACTIRLLDEDTGEMVLKAVYGLSLEYLSKGPVIAARSAFREVIERGEVSQIVDVSRDPRLQYSEEAIAEGICSRLTVGLFRDGRAFGALSVYTDRPHEFSGDEIETFQTIANQAAVAVHLARLYQERMEIRRIEQELAIAAEIQANLMPKLAPEIEGIAIAGWTRACEEVGGDFYDFIDLPYTNVGIAIGDVSGKGIPAALLMATARTALRVQAENVYAMREVIGRVNRALCRDTRPEEFATLFYGVLDARARVLTFVNAGHNFPLLFRGDGVIPLKTGGVPVGLFPEATYKEEPVRLQAGDLLVLYTDGFTEVTDRSGEQFGEERLVQAIREHRHLDPEDLVRRLDVAVDGFECDERYCDDRTMVVLKVLG